MMDDLFCELCTWCLEPEATGCAGEVGEDEDAFGWCVWVVRTGTGTVVSFAVGLWLKRHGLRVQCALSGHGTSRKRPWAGNMFAATSRGVWAAARDAV